MNLQNETKLEKNFANRNDHRKEYVLSTNKEGLPFLMIEESI